MAKPRSTRLDLSDLPRDPQNCLGSLRQNICSSFNYTRSYPRKLAILKATLKSAYNAVVALEKEKAEAEQAPDSPSKGAKSAPVQSGQGAAKASPTATQTKGE
jgi:hypothetical protein